MNLLSPLLPPSSSEKSQKSGEKEEKRQKSGLETTKHGQKERRNPALLMAQSRLVCCQKKKAFQGSASVLREFPIRKDELGKRDKLEDGGGGKRAKFCRGRSQKREFGMRKFSFAWPSKWPVDSVCSQAGDHRRRRLWAMRKELRRIFAKAPLLVHENTIQSNLLFSQLLFFPIVCLVVPLETPAAKTTKR